MREALNYAFDFEELNRTLFYGQYERINSYFFGLPFRCAPACRRARSSRSSKSVRDQVPAKVFTTEYKNPVSGDATKLRANLRTALELLSEAGYTLDGNQLVDANGQQLTFEILLNGPTIEPQRPRVPEEPAGRSASRPPSAPSTRRNTSSASAASTTT